MNNSSKTKYPDLFCRTYWSTGNYIDEPDQYHIVENRNQFAEQYRLKRCVTHNAPPYVEDYVRTTDNSYPSCFDHKECYVDQDGHYVWIVSPYGAAQGMITGTYELLLNLGWQPIDKLFCASAYTFMKRVPRGCKLRPPLRGKSSPNYQHTRYPDLFRRTYWGEQPSGKTDVETGSAEVDVLFANRNAFAEQYQLVKSKCQSTLPRYIQHMLKDEDMERHCSWMSMECYVNEQHNYVLVIHSTPDLNLPVQPSWQPIHGPLTATATASYVKQVVAKKRRRFET